MDLQRCALPLPCRDSSDENRPAENNKHSPQGTIDLHGLFVQEAISYTEQAIQRAQQQGLSTLRVIVGKGIHSAGHVAKIKPAIEDLMRK